MNKDSGLLTRFESHLLEQDHSPATIRAYMSDLSVFQKWLGWLHEGESVALEVVTKTELKAFRKHLIHEKGQKASTVNRRVQSLRLFYQYLFDQKVISSNPAQGLHFMRRQSRKQPKGA